MKKIEDAPSCPLFESTCDVVATGCVGGAVDAETDRALRGHAAECAECAGVLLTAAELRDAHAAFDAIEPGPEYWARFSMRLDARLQGDLAEVWRHSARRPFVLRAALAAAAAVVLVAGGLAVRHALRIDLPVPAEAELLERIERAPSEQVTEVLDEIAPPELDAAADDLAAAGDLLHDTALPSDADDGEDDFGPTLGLGDDDRDLLPEETRGEIG